MTFNPMERKEMSFTDEDLKRLKEDIAGFKKTTTHTIHIGKVHELLARLEAAEKLVMTVDDIVHGCGNTYCCSQFMLEWEKREKAWWESKGE